MKYQLNNETLIWAEETWEKLQIKLKAECLRIGSKIPGDVGTDGQYIDMAKADIYWWTNGFWPGILWQMYHATKDMCYRLAAQEVEQKMDAALNGFHGLHHDVGFMWLHSAVADYRLTGNKDSLHRGMHAATILAGRYNPMGHYIRAWNPECDPKLNTIGLAIIDCLMNIPLLYWAYDETQDMRFRTIAMEHADTALKYSIRQDGSSKHIISFHPETGEYVESLGGQGYKKGSSWSRGQSWSIYGMALSYACTGKKEYLDAAKKAANYFIANVSLNDYIPLVDFRAPKEPILVDTTAGVCAACGMLELAVHVEEGEQQMYVENAVRILKALENNYCNWNPQEDAILGGGTVSYHGDKKNVPIIYGDYFLLEGVLRLLDKDFRIW